MNFRTKYFYAEILLFVLKHRSYFLVSYLSSCSRRWPTWWIVHSVDRFGIFRDKSGSPDTCVEITLLILGIAAASTVFTQNLGWISCHKSKCLRVASAIIQQTSQFCRNMSGTIIIFRGISKIEWRNATNRGQIQKWPSAGLPEVEWNIDTNHADDRIRMISWWWWQAFPCLAKSKPCNFLLMQI